MTNIRVYDRIQINIQHSTLEVCEEKQKREFILRALAVQTVQQNGNKNQSLRVKEDR